MPNWKKVITSGSDAYLNSLNLTSGATGSFTGSFIGDGSGLTNLLGLGGIYEGSGTVPTTTAVAITDTLNFDSNTFVVDGTNNRVGIGTAAPGSKLHISDSTSTLVKTGVQTTSGAIGQLAGIGFATSAGVGRYKSAVGHITTNASFGVGSLVFCVDSVVDTDAVDIGDEKMRIDSTGNVGIGTTSPDQKLHVNGNIRASGSTSDSYLFGGGNNNLYLKRDNSFDLSLIQGVASAKALYLGSAGDVIVNIDTNDNDTTKAFIVGKDALKAGTELFRVQEDGNVGIGTGTPSNPLHINSTYPQLRLQISGGSTYTEFGSGTGYAVFNITNPTTNTYEFRNAGTAQLTINTSGNVGIGTGTPSEKLEVSGTSNPSIVLSNTNYSNGGFILKRDNYTESHKWWAESNTGYISYSDDQVTYKSIISYKGNTGNVGIGTNTPTSKLDVSGSVRFQNLTTTPSTGYVLQSTDALGNLDFVDVNTLITAGNGGIYEGSGTVPTTTAVAITDTLNFDSNTFVIDGTNNRVGIGTSTPTNILHIDDNATTGVGMLVTGGAIGGPLATFTRDIGGDATIQIRANSLNPQISLQATGNSFALGVNGTTFEIADNTVVGVNPRFTISNVGLTKLTPASGNALEITRITGSPSIQGTADLVIDSAGVNTLYIQNYSSGNLALVQGGGNVGIGTATPARLLSVNGIQGWESSETEMAYLNPTSTGVDFALKDSGGTSVIRFDGRPNNDSFINNGGSFGIGTATPSGVLNVIPTGTIGGATIANAGILVGTTTSGIGIDDNELYRKGGDFLIGTIDADSILFSPNGISKVKIGTTETVINDNSVDYNFRVESNNNANMLFVDGGTDRVGIGNGAPASILHIGDSEINNYIRVDSNSQQIARLGDVGSGNDGILQLYNGGSIENVRIRGGNDKSWVCINGTFGVGTNVPSAKLDVSGSVRFQNLTTTPSAGHVLQSTDALGNLDFVDVNTLITAGNGGIYEGSGTVPSTTTATLTDTLTFTGGTIKLPSISDNSLTDAALWLNGSSGALMMDNNAQRRISWNDGGGNFNIWSGGYFNGGNKYVKAGDGVAKMVMTTDVANGSINFYTAVTGVAADDIITFANHVKIGTTETIFNETSLNVNFRVESNNNANMLFVDGGTDRVGVGTNVPSAKLDVSGSVRFQNLTTTPSAGHVLQSTDALGNLDFVDVNTLLYQGYENFTEVSISSAEILAINTTPKTLLSTLTGTDYYSYKIIMEYTYGTTAYNNGGGGALIIEDTSSNLHITMANLNGIAYDFAQESFPFGVYMRPAKGIRLTSAVNPTLGDGTINVKIYYTINTL